MLRSEVEGLSTDVFVASILVRIVGSKHSFRHVQQLLSMSVPNVRPVIWCHLKCSHIRVELFYIYRSTHASHEDDLLDCPSSALPRLA